MIRESSRFFAVQCGQIDVDALDAQVIEKRKIDNERREEDLRFEAEDKRRANVMRINAEQLAQVNTYNCNPLCTTRTLTIAFRSTRPQERYRVESEINDYRRQHQKRQDTREFDLNDPQRLLHGRAARDGDNDPRLGVSSAQLFLGEDLTNPERHRVQRDQQRAWLQQQMAERRTTDADRRHADHQHQLAMEAHDRVAVRSDQAERQTRQQICAAAAEFNRRLAAEQAARRAEREREEQEDNMAEIYNNLTSDMLTENPNAADSNLGLGRKNMSSYRGKTEEELQELYREQGRQQVERTVCEMIAKKPL